MKKYFLLFTLLSLFAFTQIGWGQTTVYSQSSNGATDWNASTIWNTARNGSGSISTAAGNNLVVQNTHTITINSNQTVNSITVEAGGTTTFDGTARAITVTTDISVASTGIFITQSATTATHTMSIGGNLTNSGTFDMSRGGTTLICNVTFNNNGNQTVSGTGGTTRFNLITLNMGTSNANILEINSTNFSAPSTAFVTLTNGTLKMSGSYTFSSTFFTPAAYVIPATGGIWLNNSTVSVTAQGSSSTNNGLIRITSGTYNIGNSSGNEMGNSATGNFRMEGGTFNTSGRLNFSNSGGTFNMSNGTINITTVDNASGSTPGFNVVAGTNFTWSGGVMNLVNKNSAAGGDYSNLCSSPSISGGTLNIGTSATPIGIIFSIRGAMPNTVLDNTTNNKSATLYGDANIYGTLTLNGTGLFTVGAFTLTLQNLIAGTAANLSADNTSSIVIGGLVSGINIPSSVAALNNLTLNNSNGTLLQGPLSLAGTLTLTSGILTNGSNLTIGPSATISRSGGILASAPTFGTSVNVNYLENGTQITTGPELPTSTTVLNNLTINSSNGVLLNAPVTAKGVFTLTSGTITTTAANLLTFTEAATVGIGVATSFVNGPMAYVLTTAQAYTKNYPIGKIDWRPLVLSLTQTNPTASTYTAEMFNSAPPANAMPPDLTLSWVSGIRYHTISETGTGGGSAFTVGSLKRYYGTDDQVSNPANLRIAQGPSGGGGTWVNLGGTGTTSSNGDITSNITDLNNTIFVLANATGGTNALPVELSSFTAASSNGAIVLSWKTAVETKNHGFDVERSADNKTWTKLTFIQGHGNSNSPENYSYTDNTVGKAGKYYYRLKQLDNDGGYKYSSVAEAEYAVPDAYSLNQNYPNPFNPSTKINYSLPSDSRVTLDIYNILGVKVGQLVNQDQPAGYYSVAFSTSSLNKSITSGVYLYKITAVDKATGNSFSAIKKMIMLK